jgi:predicted MFS family arabinose efflux permease
VKEAEVKAEPFSLLQWTSLLTLAAAQFINILDFIIVMPLGPRYIQRLNITQEQFGYMVASYGFAAFVGGMISSGVIDRFERKKAMLVVFGLFTICTLLCGVATSYPTLVAARAATGIFGGVVGSMTMTIVSDLFPEGRRGFALGIVAVSFPIASFVGVPLGLSIADWTHSPWKPFLMLSGASTVIWFFMLMTLPTLNSHIRAVPDSYWKTLTDQLSIRSHLIAYLFTVFLVFSTFTVAPHIASYMVFNVGVKESEVKYIYIFGGACSFFAMPILGRMTDRFGKARVYWGVGLIAVIPTLVITNLPACSLATALLVTTSYMMLTSGRMVPAQALIASAAIPSLRAGFMSVNSAVQQLASGMAASFSARILAVDPSMQVNHEHKTIVHYPIVGAIAVVAILLSLIIASVLDSAGKERSE